MSDILLTIDGKAVSATAGMTLLEAAESVGISIPTLCHHEKLEPYGGCRICTVEVTEGDWSKMVAGCIFPVAQGLVVHTRSEKIDRIRKVLLEEMLAHAPDSEVLLDMAREYGADKDRFEKEPSFCIHCGLCVRYCAEIKQKHAVGFIDRGAHREISFVPEIATEECWECKECFPLCPTSALQAAYVMVESLLAPPEPPAPACGGCSSCA